MNVGMQKARKVARGIVGIALFILVIGAWACLWVPPPLP